MTCGAALVAGLLGFDTDDDRINNSHALMEQSGIDFSWENVTLENAHNNSVRYEIEGDGFSLGTSSAFSYDYDGKQIGITLLRNALFGDFRSAPLDTSR